MLAGVFCGVLSIGQKSKTWQICWEVALPNIAEWSYTRGDRKIRLLVPDGLRHRKYLIGRIRGPQEDKIR